MGQLIGKTRNCSLAQGFSSFNWIYLHVKLMHIPLVPCFGEAEDKLHGRHFSPNFISFNYRLVL